MPRLARLALVLTAPALLAACGDSDLARGATGAAGGAAAASAVGADPVAGAGVGAAAGALSDDARDALDN